MVPWGSKTPLAVPAAATVEPPTQVYEVTALPSAMMLDVIVWLLLKDFHVVWQSHEHQASISGQDVLVYMRDDLLSNNPYWVADATAAFESLVTCLLRR